MYGIKKEIYTKMSFLLLQKCFCIKNIQLGMHAPTVVVVVMSDWLADKIIFMFMIILSYAYPMWTM